MLNFFKQIPIYIKISTNKIEITNLNTGESVSGTAVVPFSTTRLVVSNFFNAESLILALLKDLKLKRARLKILIQQIENVEGGLSDIEKRALRDLGEQSGAVFVKLVEHTRHLKNDEAFLELKKK